MFRRSHWRARNAHVYDDLHMPNDEFDYDEFVQEEFGGGRKLKPRGVNAIWWVTGLVLLLFVIAAALRSW